MDLGREHDPVAPGPVLGQPSSQDRFGRPDAQMATILIGGVDEVDARVDRSVQDRKRLRLGGLRPEVHGAEAQRADLER